MDLELREIKKLYAGFWYSPEFSGERIPSLDEVLKWAKGRILLNIEIKPAKAEIDALTGSESMTTHFETSESGAEKKVLELIRKHEMNHQVVISSFSYPVLRRVRNADKTLPTARSEEHTSELQSRGHLVC